MILPRLADYTAEQATQVLPAAVLHAAKRVVIDWFAASFPGWRMPPTTGLVAAHQDELGQGASTVLGQATVAHAPLAAWMNGTSAHAAEFDDIYRAGALHPGAPVIAAALAVAEATEAPAGAFLNAVVGGYEVATRVAEAMQPAHGRCFHATGTVGTLGAAAAAAMVLRPGDALVAQHALAMACTFAAGLQQTFLSEGTAKALHAGHAAMMGVLSAKAAAAGVTAPSDMLEGLAGFGAALGGQADWSLTTQGLGEVFNICAVTHKIHGCCGLAFASIDAALEIVQRTGVRAADIAALRVFVPAATLKVANRLDPRTALEARFSLAYVVSHALLFGAVRLDAFENERMSDPALQRLMSRVSVLEDPVLTAAGLSQQRGSAVELEMEDGHLLKASVAFRRGDPEAPLSDDEISVKFMDLGVPVIGVATAERLLSQLWSLERIRLETLVLGSLAPR